MSSLLFDLAETHKRSASGTGYGGASGSSGGAEPSSTASSGSYGNSTSSGGSSGSGGGNSSSNARISFIETMHGFQGFVYDIDVSSCCLLTPPVVVRRS